MSTVKMKPNKLVIIYSKYSPRCQSMLAKCKPYPISPDVHFLCVDNSKVRERVKQLNINSVPCVFFMYPDGKVEHFESDTIDEWIINQLTPLNDQEEEVNHYDEEQVTSVDDIRYTNNTVVEQSIKKKSISDIAAEMAAERDLLQKK